ncbi:hypothetical protein PTKIN_Ptkin05aG0027200 [Pterospermum kingtungense]
MAYALRTTRDIVKTRGTYKVPGGLDNDDSTRSDPDYAARPPPRPPKMPNKKKPRPSKAMQVGDDDGMRFIDYGGTSTYTYMMPTETIETNPPLPGRPPKARANGPG